MQQEHIQVPVAVVVEKIGLGAESRVSQPILGGLFAEGRHAIGIVAHIDEQLIRPLCRRQLPGVTHVNIHPPIAVHIRHGHTGLPWARPYLDICGSRDILEGHSTSVKVQLTFAQVAGKIQILQAIVIHIAHRHAPTIIEILIHHYIGIRSFGKFIGETDMGIGRG